MAGLAVTRALLRHGGGAVDVTIFDPGAPGCPTGASSVAAGLLHPLSPRGKPVWMGLEGLAATVELAAEAQAALNDAASSPGDAPRVVVSERVLRPALSGHLKVRCNISPDHAKPNRDLFDSNYKKIVNLHASCPRF